jgi:cell division protein FtsB
MTGIDLPADAGPPARPRARLPATRGGLAWLVVLILVGAFLAVQVGRQVYANWEISQRAGAIRAEIAAVEDENAALRGELRYLQSDGYLSAEARRLTNLGQPGEEVLIIPRGAEEPLPPELAVTEPAKPMLQQWVDLFFGP